MIAVALAKRIPQQRRTEPVALMGRIDADQRQIPMCLVRVIRRHLLEEGADLVPSLRKTGAKAAAAAAARKPPEEQNLNLREAIDNVERELIMKALEKTAGNRTEAAALLGLNRTTLVEKLRKLE